jgi:hypothetical protein
MSTNLDLTYVRPTATSDESPFAYGEATVLQLRAQPFEVQDELGTVVTMPIETNQRMPWAATPVSVPTPTPVPPAPSFDTVFAEEDPLSRMEQKLDQALWMIEKLQQRIESLDLTLARVLSR